MSEKSDAKPYNLEERTLLFAKSVIDFVGRNTEDACQ